MDDLESCPFCACLEKIIEDLMKVDDEINHGTKWSQSVKLNKVIANLKAINDEVNTNEA